MAQKAPKTLVQTHFWSIKLRKLTILQKLESIVVAWEAYVLRPKERAQDLYLNQTLTSFLQQEEIYW